MQADTKQEKYKAIFDTHSNADVKMRLLEKADFDKGYIDLLKQLTKVGKVGKEEFEKRFDEMAKDSHFYTIIVLEHKSTGKVMGNGMIFFEKKFARGCGTAGHVEDIIVDQPYKNQGWEVKIMDALAKIGDIEGVYKMVLDCPDSDCAFYESVGYKKYELHMAWYKENAPQE
jgi:glucosamine-phosphate N-acetyltransferase